MPACRLTHSALALALAALGLTSLEGCRDPTEVVVVVDTDVDPRSFVFIGFQQGQSGGIATASPQTLPATLGLTQSSSIPEFDIAVTLNTTFAFGDPTHPPIVTRRASHIRFSDGEMKMLFLPLFKTCVCTGTNCPDNPECADLIAPPLSDFNEDAIPRLAK